METTDKYSKDPIEVPFYKVSRLGKILGGIVLISVGKLWLLNQLSIITLPAWVFTWEMALIVIGFYIGAKHTFRHAGWLIPVFVGLGFLLDDIFPGFNVASYFWPLLFIAVGTYMVFSPRRKFWNKKQERWKMKFQEFHHQHSCQNSGEDYIESVTIFSGLKKNIITKQFKGGDVVTLFGGAEINFSQADIEGKVVLEIAQIFGGTKLIVPSHWDVQSELVAVMGGIDDKRNVDKNLQVDTSKVLVLRGTTVFGGIDIRSY